MVFAILLCVIATFQIVSIRPGQGWGDDWAQYVAHARNIAEGRPYAQTGYVPNPEEPIAPAKYPPGFPLLLAPIYALRGLDLEALKIPVVFSFIAALGLFAFLATRWDTTRTAFALTALLGFHPFFWDFKNNILSDLPFLCFLLLALLISERVLESKTRDPANRWLSVLLGIAWWGAYSMRTVGLILPLSVILAAVIQRRGYQRLLIPLGVFLILAIIQTILFQGPAEYLTKFSFQPRLMLEGERAYLSDFRTLLDPHLGPHFARIEFWSLTALAVAGAVRFWRAGHQLVIVFSVLYLAAVLVWPFYEGLRMLIPLVPFYFLGAVVGLKLVAAKAGKFRSAILVSALLASLGFYLREYQLLTGATEVEGVKSVSAQSLFQFIRASTPDTAVVIFKKPRALALYTGRTGAVYSRRHGFDHPWAFPDRIGATHLISIRASTQDSLYLRSLTEKRPNAVTRVFTNDRFDVYELGDRNRLLER